MDDMRDEWAAVIEQVARDGLPGPRDLDATLDALEAALSVPAEVAAIRAEAFKAGAEAMREAAAQDTDCGCAVRGAVLARLAEAGHKRASYLCPHGDVCCALQAAAVRALPLPDSPNH